MGCALPAPSISLAGTDSTSWPSTQQSDGVWQCPATVPCHCIGQGQLWCHAVSLMLVGCSDLPLFSLAGSSFTLAWAAKDQGELRRFLMQNLSLPNSTAELLLGSSINLREVGHLWALQGSVLPCEWHPAWICPTLPPHAKALLGKEVQRWCSAFGTPGSCALILMQVYRQFFDSFPLVPDETHERDLWDGFGPTKKMTQLEVRSGAACRRHGRVEPILLSLHIPPQVIWGCLSQ